MIECNWAVFNGNGFPLNTAFFIGGANPLVNDLQRCDVTSVFSIPEPNNHTFRQVSAAGGLLVPIPCGVLTCGYFRSFFYLFYAFVIYFPGTERQWSRVLCRTDN